MVCLSSKREPIAAGSAASWGSMRATLIVRLLRIATIRARRGERPHAALLRPSSSLQHGQRPRHEGRIAVIYRVLCRRNGLKLKLGRLRRFAALRCVAPAAKKASDLCLRHFG